MRLTRAWARNMKGLENFDRECGDVNVFAGWNGEGKTSALDLICSLFSCKSDRALLRTGSEEGEIGAILSNGSESWTISRKLTPAGVSEPTIKSDRTGKVGAYATFIKSILDTATMDPLRHVMTMPPKDKAKILLETMPLELEAGALKAALAGLPDFAREADTVQAKLPALDAIRHFDQENKGIIYMARRDARRDADSKRKHAQELLASVVEPEGGADWRTVVRHLQEALRQAAAGEEADRGAAEKTMAEIRAQVDANYTAQERAVDSEIDNKIRELEKARATSKSVLASRKAIDVANLEEQHRSNLQEVSARWRPEQDRLTQEHARAEERARNIEQAARTKANAEAAQKEAAELEAKAKRLGEALEQLALLRERLLEKLPINGLSFEGGSAYLNGVPLEEVNTAQQGLFWIRVAVMRAIARGSGVVILDNAEKFDDRNFPRVIQACKSTAEEHGIQFFIGRVEQHDLTVTTA